MKTYEVVSLMKHINTVLQNNKLSSLDCAVLSYYPETHPH